VIDVNVSLHRWPFRRLYGDDPASLAAFLREKCVTQAWVGSFDGLLNRDIAAVNARLAADCKEHGAGILLPFGSINPKLPGWQEDLRRCHEVHRMRSIRLHPNYHGYALAEPLCKELLAAAANRKLVVQIAAAMEDERTQHPLVRVAPVDLGPLPAVLRAVPGLRIVLLNAGRNPHARELSAAGARFDIATVEGAGGVAKFAGEISAQRVLFGSHAPFFYFESAVLKVKEAGLPDHDTHAITEANARQILAGAPG
jgi:predicted TIM-barrel fold metal-dependent hydrolase